MQEGVRTPPSALAAAALVAQGVELVVVGGCALLLLDMEQRCSDLDIVPQRSRDNLTRLVDGLEALGAKPPLRASTLMTGSIRSVDSPYGKIDVLLQGSRAQYDELRCTGSTCLVEDVPVPVASVADLLRMRELHRTGQLYD